MTLDVRTLGAGAVGGTVAGLSLSALFLVLERATDRPSGIVRLGRSLRGPGGGHAGFGLITGLVTDILSPKARALPWTRSRRSLENPILTDRFPKAPAFGGSGQSPAL